MDPLRVQKFGTAERKAKMDHNGIVLNIVEATEDKFNGTVDVANFGYEKRVYVRYSADSWATCHDVQATWDGNCRVEDCDTFAFSVDWPQKDGVKQVEFAACCEQNGTSYWDNNNGKNYLVTFKPGKATAAQPETSDRPCAEIVSPCSAVVKSGDAEEHGPNKAATETVEKASIDSKTEAETKAAEFAPNSEPAETAVAQGNREQPGAGSNPKPAAEPKSADTALNSNLAEEAGVAPGDTEQPSLESNLKPAVEAKPADPAPSSKPMEKTPPTNGNSERAESTSKSKPHTENITNDSNTAPNKPAENTIQDKATSSKTSANSNSKPEAENGTTTDSPAAPSNKDTPTQPKKKSVKKRLARIFSLKKSKKAT